MYCALQNTGFTIRSVARCDIPRRYQIPFCISFRFTSNLVLPTSVAGLASPSKPYATQLHFWASLNPVTHPRCSQDVHYYFKWPSTAVICRSNPRLSDSTPLLYSPHEFTHKWEHFPPGTIGILLSSSAPLCFLKMKEGQRFSKLKHSYHLSMYTYQTSRLALPYFSSIQTHCFFSLSKYLRPIQLCTLVKLGYIVVWSAIFYSYLRPIGMTSNIRHFCFLHFVMNHLTGSSWKCRILLCLDNLLPLWMIKKFFWIHYSQISCPSTSLTGVPAKGRLSSHLSRQRPHQV